MTDCKLARRIRRRIFIAAAAMPLLASSTCAERSVDFLLGSNFLNDYFDNRSNVDKADDILNEIGDLWDDVF